ncbi:MAG: putative glycoside hydrolase [Spirochaetota bacterium]
MKSLNKLLSSMTIILSFFLCCQTLLHSENYKLVLLTSDRGVLVSDDSGRSWDDLNRGLPQGIIPDRIQGDRLGNLYMATASSGVFYLETGKSGWKDISSDLLLSPLYNLKEKKYRKISAIAVSKDGSTVILATKHGIFRKDKGKQWTHLPGYTSDKYYTALAASGDAVYAGTSCDGLFRISGQRAHNISSNLPREQYSKTHFFREEISAIEPGEKNAETVYAGFGFGGGVYASCNSGASWKSLGFPGQKDALYDVFDIKASGDELFVSAEGGVYKFARDHKWLALPFGDLLKKLSLKKGNLSVLITEKSKNYPSIFYCLNRYRKDTGALAEKARGKRALYTNAYSVNKKLHQYISTIKKCGLNAIVIDVKDDWGDVCYSSENKTAIGIGAVKKYFDAKKTLETLKKNGIYSIARIVVFKDKRLYEAYNSKYAIWDSKNNAPWKGNPREYWNDPYSGFVRNYNIEIAAEAERLGFDEIQFDYIRFPSDGPVDRCHYRFKENKDIYKPEILACFLEEAKKKTGVPVSVDIYGFNMWFRLGNDIGQDAEAFSEIADAVCPMVYPSHYGRSFFTDTPVEKRPYGIVLASVRRARKITGNALVRPYLQAFNLLSPTWGPEYINSQVKASMAAGGDGYTFWNAGGNYDMVIKAAEGGSK